MEEERDREMNERIEPRADQMVMEEEPGEETAADSSEPAGDETDELTRLRDELNATRDRLLRQAAEYQNYRRRKEDDVAMAGLYGRMRVVSELLDVYDDFERSVAAAEDARAEDNSQEALEALKTGVELVYKKFSEKLAKLGVEPIEAVGKPFHEDVHEALMQQPAPDGTEPGTVIAEIQKGYRMGDRVLRHAKVVVAQ